jgi:hypothetical protein
MEKGCIIHAGRVKKGSLEKVTSIVRPLIHYLDKTGREGEIS